MSELLVERALKDKIEYLKTHMVDRLDRSDEALFFILKGFAFDEKLVANTWNKALSKADVAMDEAYYQRLGHIGFPIGEHIHKFFDTPEKAEKAINNADEASKDAFRAVLNEEFYHLIGTEIPA